MKKILIRIFALMALAVCVLSLVACNVSPRPNLDLAKAKDELEKRDYKVTYYDKDEEIEELGVVKYFYATKSGNTLIIKEYKSVAAAKLALKAIKAEVQSEIKLAKLNIKTAKYYLRKYEKKIGSYYIDSLEDSIKRSRRELNEERTHYGRSGKYVWEGSRKAIESTKK